MRQSIHPNKTYSQENPRGADVSHEVIIAGTDEDTAEEDDNNKNVADDEEYNADDDDDDDEEEEEEDVTGGETYVHSPSVNQMPIHDPMSIASGANRPLFTPEPPVVTPEKIRRDTAYDDENQSPSTASCQPSLLKTPLAGVSPVEMDGPVRRVAPLISSKAVPPADSTKPNETSNTEKSGEMTQSAITVEPDVVEIVYPKETTGDDSVMSITEEPILPPISAGIDGAPIAERKPSWMNILDEIYAIEARCRDSDALAREPSMTEARAEEVADDADSDVILDDLLDDLPLILNEELADELLLDVNHNELPSLNPLELEGILSSI